MNSVELHMPTISPKTLAENLCVRVRVYVSTSVCICRFACVQTFDANDESVMKMK